MRRGESFRYLGLVACLSLLGVLACSRRTSVVACRVSYGGEEKRLEFPVTVSPYTVKVVDIAGRFAFKVIYLREPSQLPSINVYAYQRTETDDRLLQEGKYRPPFTTGADARYGFTGLQLVYSAEHRELSYWCDLVR
jgi:hypothetical protein